MCDMPRIGRYCRLRMNSEEGLTSYALCEPHRIYATDEQWEKDQIEALNLYLDQRRQGRLYSHRGPERVQEESPLVRNEQASEVKPLTPGALHRIIHDLFLKAGLLSHDIQTRYVLRPHSIRKFFRTQLAALGVNADYIEYMMGHKVNTYHDVKMIGIEKLRQIYARSGLSVRPKAPSDKLEMLKEFTRSLGLDPEKIIIRDALAEPHRATAIATDDERVQFAALGEALKEWIKREASNAHSEQEKRYTLQK